MARICLSCLRSLPNRRFWVLERRRPADRRGGTGHGYLADTCADCRKRRP